MSRKFSFLTKQSLNKKIKSKWFLGINIMLAIVVIALININSIISFFGGDFNKEVKILVIDNTEVSYQVFKESMNTLTKEEDTGKITVKESTQNEEKLKKKLKDNQIAIIFNNDEENFVSSKIISNEKIDNTTYQYITQGLNNTKTNVALTKTNTDPTLLAKISSPMEIERVVLSNEKSVDENMEMVMGTVFPTLILPFFMLIIFLVQMIGGEICEEKTTKSMEIIISNVSPKVHLFSKVLASNIFILIQAILLVIYSVLGILISTKGQLQIDPNVDTLLTATLQSGFINKVLTLLPAVIILMVLSFIAYSLIAGILASMTTNMEDFSQIQTPIMLVLLAGYYLAIMAGMFNGSTFIRVLSYIPFLSCLIAPSLYILGQITMIDVVISILILILTIFLMTRYGLKIYKIGILNYSNEKIWTRFAKAIKSKDI
ncbi:MAG TPA: ABC transporter permease [Candidatus Faecimonas gallistercoris]|mgnify:FL=1|nr:ABC transporter permease [Candidatus Faecimonas gallistercoris]